MRLVPFVLFLLLLNACNQKKHATGSTEHPAQPGDSFLQKEYAVALKEIATTKQLNKQRWIQLPKLVKEKLFTEAVCKTIIPHWYGTPWNFYGMSETPGKGTIACGYFVTTVLRDAGVPLKRIQLAQSASEVIIHALAADQYISRYSNWPIKKFVTAIRQQGYGLYIAGLDSHVGFIYNNGNEVYFIHANYAGKREVLKEKALESFVLSRSKYRVVGKISADDKLLNKWISSP